MPLYSLECPRCGDLDEHFMGANDALVEVPCDHCGWMMSRAKDRAYYADIPAIRGDTCAGCDNMSNYYDDGLDTFITSRDHRKRIMEERKLTDYEPTSEGKAARKESAYIRANAPKDDPKALEAARQQSRDMDGKRKKRVIKTAMDKARKSLDKA
jgi:hypothetical protein